MTQDHEYEVSEDILTKASVVDVTEIRVELGFQLLSEKLSEKKR